MTDPNRYRDPLSGEAQADLDTQLPFSGMPNADGVAVPQQEQKENSDIKALHHAEAQMYDEQQEQDDGADQLAAMRRASSITPEYAAYCDKLSADLDVPFNAVAHDKEAARKEADVPAWQQIARFAPKTSALLQEKPEIFHQVQDDAAALKDLEVFKSELKKNGVTDDEYNAATKTIFDPAESIKAELNKSLETGTPYVMPSRQNSAFFTNLDAVGTQFNESAIQSDIGIRSLFNEMQESLGVISPDEALANRDNLTREYKDSAFRSSEATPNFEHSLFPKSNEFAFGGLSSLAQSAPVMAVGLINPIVGIGLAGSQTGLSAYPKYASRGGNLMESLSGAFTEGAIEVLTEKNPMGFAAEQLGKMSIKAFAKHFLGKEMIGEQAATFGQDLTDTLIANPNKTMAEFWRERPEAIVQTAFAVGINTAAMSSVQHIANVAMKYDGSNEAHKKLNEEMDIVKKLKIAGLNGARAKQLLDNMDGDSIKDVYVDPTQLFNQGQISPQQFKNAMPNYAVQIDEALEVGGLLRMDKNELMLAMRNDEEGWAALSQHLKSDPAADSLYEATQSRDALTDELNKIADKRIKESKDEVAAREQWDALKEAARQRLADSGMDKEAIEHAATMDASVAHAFSTRTGLDAGDILSEQFGRVSRRLSSGEILGGVFNQYAGEQAQGADLTALQRAKQAVDSGADPEQIRQETGWHKWEDGKWRFEIDDSQAKQKLFSDKGYFGEQFNRYVLNEGDKPDGYSSLRVGDILDHSALFDAYPSLADIRIIPEKGTGASFSSGQGDPVIGIGTDNPMKDVKSAILHEIQHAIQEQEGFARGGSVGEFMSPANNELAARKAGAYQKISEINAKLKTATGDEYQRLLSERSALVKDAQIDGVDIKENAHNQYKRLAGEVEARDTQARAGMSAEERKASKPYISQGIPDDQVIVRKGGDGVRFNQSPNKTQEKLDEINFFESTGIYSKDEAATLRAKIQKDGGRDESRYDENGYRITARDEAGAYLSHFPATTEIHGEESAGIRRIRQSSDRITVELQRAGGKPQEVHRTVSDRSLGPFSSYVVDAKSYDHPAEPKRGWLEIRYYGKEQIDAGLTGEPALTVIIGKDGEFGINGPSPESETFKAFKERGWAEEAKQKDGVINKEHTRLINPHRDDGQFSPSQVKDILADAHARLRAWRKEDRVGLNWGRATGATGGEFGNEGAAFFQSQNAKPFDGKEVAKTKLPEGTTHIDVDGVSRSALNSNGEPIHWSEEGARNFWRWFGDSKVVDADGRPLVVYHGTDATRTVFDRKHLGRSSGRGTGTDWGFFFAKDRDHAEYWANNAGGDRVVESVYLRIKNPLVIEDSGNDGGATLDRILDERLQDSDHDGAIIHGMQDDDSGELRTAYLVFDSEQIKSATGNSGAFDGSNPNTLHQDKDAPRGTFYPVTRDIMMMPNSDLSTYLHESGHLYLEVMASLAGHEAASEGLRADMDAALKWFGVKGENASERLAAWNAMTLEEKRNFHEKWAESFEQYLFEGVAPSPELREAFKNFRQWLTHVYKSMAQFLVGQKNAKLNDEMRGVFDRILASEEQINTMREARNMLPLFTVKPANITADEWERYEKAAKDFAENSIEQMTSRSLRDMKWLSNAKNKTLRKLQREAAQARRESRMEATTAVLGQPVYRAWQFLTAPIEGAAARNKRARNSEHVDSARDSLLTAIAKLGGLNKEEAVSQYGLDPKDFLRKGGVFGKPVLRKEGGLSPDAMAEALSQFNYLPLDEHGKWDILDLEDLLREEAAGNPQYSADVDMDVLLGEPQRAFFDAENVDYMGGRLNRIDIRNMFDDIQLAEMQGGQVDTAGKLMQQDRKRSFPESKTVEFGKFKTGRPVEFKFIHNTESATSIFGKPKKDAPYGRGIEPSGRYVNEGSLNGYGSKNMIEGDLRFENPLVLDVETWKQDLYDHYKKRGKALSLALISDGYDGVVTVRIDERPGRSHSSEILDLTTFDESKALYQGGDNPDLFVAHNLSEENLIHADELGGLAAPSLGVSRTTTGGFGGFGGITLLADKEILTDRYARTFDADVYSPRHPRAQENISYGNYTNLVQRINENQGEVHGLEFSVDHDSLMRNGANDLANSEAFQNYYLVSKGIIIKPKRAKAAPAILNAIKYLKKNAKHDSAYAAYNLRDEDWFKSLAEEHYKAEFEKWKNLRDDFTPAELVKYGPFEEDGSLKYYLYNELALLVENYHKKGGQDSAATRGAIAKHFRTDKGSAELQEFAEDELAKISSGKQLVKYTKNGNQKRSAYTLENIVAEMTRELRGGEGFNYGAGSVRSAFAFEFKHNTIDSIKSHKNNIVSKQEMDKVRDDANNKLSEALDKLAKFYKYDSTSWGYTNDASSAIAEGPKGWSSAFKMTTESKKIITDLVSYLRNLPSEYFETKMQRAVGIEEFKTAVVPKGISAKAMAILEKNGLNVVTYDPKKEGSRTAAIAKQKDILFQENGKDSKPKNRTLESMGVLSDDGIHPDAVADLFGFPSTEAMIKSLLTAPDPLSEINRLTDEIMVQRYADLATPQAIEQAALAALHSDAHSRFLATELAILNRAVGKPRFVMQAAKQYADRIVSALRIADLNPAQYEMQAAKAGKETERLLGQNKTADAAMSKRNQILHDATARLVRDTKDDVAKALKFFERTEKAARTGKLRADVGAQVLTLLDTYDLRKGTTLKAAELADRSLAEFVQQQSEAMDMPMPSLADAVLRGGVKRSYKTMSVEEFNGLVDAVKYLEAVGRREYAMYKAVRDQSFAQERSAILDRLREYWPDAFDDEGNPLPTENAILKTGAYSAKKKARSVAHELLTPETVTNILEGGEFGQVHDSLFARLSNAMTDRSILMKELHEKLQPFMDAYTWKERREFGKKDIGTAAIGEPLSRENALVAALLAGSKEGRDRLANYGWNDARIAQVVNLLDAKDIALANAIFDVFDNTLWPKLESLNKRTMGVSPPKILPVPVQAKNGTLTGGYFPIRYDGDMDARSSSFDDKQALDLMKNGIGLSAKTNQSSSQARVDGVKMRPLLSLSVMSKVAGETAHDIALREAVMDSARLLNNAEIAQGIQNIVGMEGWKSLKKNLGDIASPPHEAGGMFASAANFARRNVVTALMSGVGTAVQNFTGLLPAFSRVHKGLLLKEIADVPHLIEKYKDTIEKSAYMRERFGQFERDLVRDVDKLSMKKGVMPDQSVWFAMMAWVDRVVSVPVWQAAYREGAAKGVDAVEYADHIVRQTQGGGRLIDRAPIMRGGALQQLFTMFYSYFNGQLNMVARDAALAKREVAQGEVSKAAARLAASAIFVWILPAVVSELTRQAPDDEDDEEKLQRVVRATILYPTAMVPLLRDFAPFVYDKVAGNRAFDPRLTPVQGFVSTLSRAATAAGDIGSDDFDEKDFKALMMGVGFTFNLPAILFTDVVLGTKALLNGETDDIRAPLIGMPPKS